MSMMVEDRSGVPVEVYVRDAGGRIEGMARAVDRETFEAGAVGSGLMVEVEVDGEIVRKPAPGVDLSVIGVISKHDPDTEMPQVIDGRYHVNLLISSPALDATTDGYPNWQSTAINWTLHGTPDAEVNARESALVFQGISLIDPDTIKSPDRVWL